MGLFSTKSAVSPQAQQRRQVTYVGSVQGVGFRYRTRTIAKGFAICGHVRNLADGCVELVAEGASQELDAFLAEVAQQMASQISEVRTDIRPALGDLSGFEIRY